MKRNNKLAIALAVSLALGVVANAQADPIIFDPTGTPGGGGDIAGVEVFDWNVGNAVALGGNPSGGIAVGDNINLVYQANLSVVTDGTNVLFTNGGGGDFFTVAAQFGETVSAVGANNSATFVFNPADPNNFFTIYATGAAGNNLTGEGFNTGTPILTGSITQVVSSSFTITNTTPVLLDQFGGDDLGGQQTVSGTGASSITITISVAGVDTNYFPDLVPANTITLSFFNTSQVTPYNQVNPSNCFLDANPAAGCQGITRNLGAVNGAVQNTGVDQDFQFQADGNQSFVRQQVPEPASLALLGLGLGAMGLIGRRRRLPV